MKTGMGSHQSQKMKNDEWLTPPYILNELGEFDLDPCSPEPQLRPWSIAKQHYDVYDDGLNKDWFGRVFLNPPYGRESVKWLQKMTNHRNGIALIFARTETDMFFRYVWNEAHSLLFIKGRLFFHLVTGERAKSNSGAPSVLISYSEYDTNILENCNIEGKLIKL